MESEIFVKTDFNPLRASVCANLISSSTLSSLLISSSYFPNKSFVSFSLSSPDVLSIASAKSCFTAYKSTFISLTVFTKSKARTLSIDCFKSANPRFVSDISIEDESSL